jgi:hypothetical protein
MLGADGMLRDRQIGVRIVTRLLEIIVESVIAFRVLDAEPMRQVFMSAIGKIMDRHIVRRLFLATWKRVSRVAFDRLAQEEVVAYAGGGDGWTDRGGRRFWACCPIDHKDLSGWSCSDRTTLHP